MANPEELHVAPVSARHKLRLAYFVSHPIQYQVPLLRRIAQEQDIDLTVFFTSDFSVRNQGYADEGFGVSVKWDVSLLGGYKHIFLPRLFDAVPMTFFRPLNLHIRKLLRQGNFDAIWVHGYSHLTQVRAIWAASALGAPTLMRGETTLLERKRPWHKILAKKLFFRLLKPRIAAALAIGDANTAYWRDRFGEDFPIFPFRYCVDNDFFQNRCALAAETKEEFRRSLGLEVGRPIILFASKLIPRKRCGDLLEAFLQLAKSSDPNLRPYLLIVGDGDQRSVLETRAKAANGGDVRFLGFRNQTELPRFYDLCNVFVLASDDEPWGLAVNEAMNAGRAVIVTDRVGCQQDLVKDGVNGHVVRVGDVGALAKSLQAVLADEETWQSMGNRSLQIVRDFSFDQNVEGLRQALQAVIPWFSAAQHSQTFR